MFAIQGGFISTGKIQKKIVHQVSNADHKADLFGSHKLKPGHTVIDRSEFQSPPFTSIKQLMPSALDKGRADSNQTETFIPKIKSTDNFDGMKSGPPNININNIDDIPHGTSTVAGRFDKTTGFSSVTITPLNTGSNQDSPANLSTAITGDDPIMKGQGSLKHHSLQIQNAGFGSNGEPLIKFGSNSKTSEGSHSISSTTDGTADKESVDSKNSKANEAANQILNYQNKYFPSR